MSTTKSASLVPIYLSLVAFLLGGTFPSAADEPGTKKDSTEEAKPATPAEKAEAVAKDVTQGALRIVGEDAKVVECPLEHTDVVADVSGFLARVTVKQTFHNPTKEKIEAVYVFPLPHEGAIDRMDMTIGERTIVGVIKRRDEARDIYQQAISQGQTAALLEQERPNIFTQTVGNIAPGQRVDIEISYVDVLKYDQGSYEFQFPMVVGPRYNPGGTNRPVDADKLNPPILKPGERTGHDISLTVNLDAGVPIQNLKNSNHKVHTIRKGESQARIRLLQEDSLPNKDFVLRYEVAGKKPEMAMLAHTGEYSGDARAVGNGYFMLMIQPQEDERLKKTPPRELVFLVDVSGSMKGAPTEKVKEAMTHMLKQCRDQDTLQIVTFSNQPHQLFEKPLPTNKENLDIAMKHVASLEGSGGTQMLEGVKQAIEQPVDNDRVRIVVMLTDGKVGNEAQIIEHVGKHCGDRIRFWVVAIGSSPNLFLADGVARQAGGMGKRLNLEDDAAALSTEVMTRIQRAQLADVQIDWGKLQVSETYPTRLPELWAGRPVIVYGRFAEAGEGNITVRGNVEGEAVQWPVAVTLPKEQPDHDTLAKVWARQKIEDLMHQSYYGGSPAVEEAVTALALDYRLMSQYTSFVAVDPKVVDELDRPAKRPRRMFVSVPLPAGTEYSGFFGGEVDELAAGRKLVEELGQFNADRANFRTTTESLKELIVQQERLSLSLDSVQLHEQAYRIQSPRGRASSLPGMPAATRFEFGLALTNPQPAYQQSTSHYYLQTFGQPQGETAASALGRRAWSYARGGRAGMGGAPAFAGRGMQLGTPLVIDSDGIEEFERESQRLNDWSITAHVLAAQAKPAADAAQTALESASDLQAKDNLTAARAEFLRAFFLDSAAANVGQSNGQVANQALLALEDMHSKQIEQWSKDVPALRKKLDLVLRDKSIAEALEEVARASEITAELIAGSEQDSAALLPSAPRVTYLDLHGATVAEALDWILLPARMNWKVESGNIIAGSERRAESKSVWVYDVSSLAVPSVKELNDLKDQEKAIAAAKSAADEFIAVVRTKLQAKADDQSVVWFAPGQLLVIADRAAHQAAAELFAKLADPKFDPPKEFAKLHAVTSQRAQDRQVGITLIRELGEQIDALGVLNYFSPRLLTAATAGDIDDEALTELTIVWNDKKSANLLDGKANPVAMRSTWMIREAARALPGNERLAQLAERAARAGDASAVEALAALEKSNDDNVALVAVVFAALAKRDDDSFQGKALELLDKRGGSAPLAVAARALLAPRGEIDRHSLLTLIDAGVAGDDNTLLLALGCFRAGGEVWESFRAESRRLVGQQPLSGETVVLINRLDRIQLASQE